MKKLLYLIGLIMTLGMSSCDQSSPWEGTWRSSEGTIVVTLNATTMKANVELFNGDVQYTTDWDIVDENSIVWSDYASSQYTMMTKDGLLYGFNSFTGRMTDKGVRLRKQ